MKALWWLVGRALDLRQRWRTRGPYARLGPLVWGPYVCPRCRRRVTHDDFTCTNSGTYPTEWGAGHFAVGTMTCPRCGLIFDWEESSP